MNTINRLLSLAVASAALIAPVAGAQTLATYGGVELAGLGEGSAILGVSLSSGQLGWSPTFGANAQRYTFRTSSTTTESRNAFVPSAGLQYRTHEGAIQGTVGYAFVSGGDATPSTLGIGGTAGSTSGVVLGLQGNYWANEQEHQAIISYNTRSQYLWTRFRAAHQINPGTRDMPIYLGGELVYQGGPVKSLPGNPSAHRTQFGPTINFHLTPNFHLGFQGGYRTSDPNGVGTGYGRVEFLVLTPL